MELAKLGLLLDLGPFVYGFLVDAFAELANGVGYRDYLLEDLVHDNVSDVNQDLKKLLLLTHAVYLHLELIAIKLAHFRASHGVSWVGDVERLAVV